MERKNRGGEDLIQDFKDKLANDIAENFQRFQQENERKRKFTEVRHSVKVAVVLIVKTKTHDF